MANIIQFGGSQKAVTAQYSGTAYFAGNPNPTNYCEYITAVISPAIEIVGAFASSMTSRDTQANTEHTVKIYGSTDGGTTWTQLATNTLTNTNSWEVLNCTYTRPVGDTTKWNRFKYYAMNASAYYETGVGGCVLAYA